eukprot:GHRQ01011785.1.p1 GENE.GHRQ01011785.1~~GHRQ01011785.1.p1  ORF type:complete len:269 (+),score=72.87 GHRQ01011785.1:202-1008(+)
MRLRCLASSRVTSQTNLATHHLRFVRTLCRSSVRREMTVEAKLVPSPEVLELWRNAQAVCFDVDSTFCVDESIDELAAFLGVGDQVAALTAKAMGGTVKFQDALAERLSLMACSQQQLQAFLQAHPAQLSPGIPELVAKLQQQGKAVFLVSGGFRQIIHPIAESLGIPLSHVHANRLLFKEDGSYAGFDAEEFTSRSGGKAEAVRDIKRKFSYDRIVMVGDGATDMEARQEDAANIFIGYGGVVERPNIAAQADWYIYDIHALLQALL